MLNQSGRHDKDVAEKMAVGEKSGRERREIDASRNPRG